MWQTKDQNVENKGESGKFPEILQNVRILFKSFSIPEFNPEKFEERWEQ